MTWRVEHGDCLDLMAAVDADSVDAVVTDPPYGLEFMGNDWDHGVPGVPFWEAALRVAKPGAFLLAFGGTRTVHRLVCAIEDAGWEIRDQIMWLYGQGFPKPLDISKAIDGQAGAERPIIGYRRRVPASDQPAPHGQYLFDMAYEAEGEDDLIPITAPATAEAKEWAGWGAALKPACEPICMARKPLEGTVAANVLKWGTGGINVDGCRIPIDTAEALARNNFRTTPALKPRMPLPGAYNPTEAKAIPVARPHPLSVRHDALGRWPANVVLSCACGDGPHGPDCPVALLDEQSGERTSGKLEPHHLIHACQSRCKSGPDAERHPTRTFGGDTGGASRFFTITRFKYCAKASSAERNRGLEGMAEGKCGVGALRDSGRGKTARNLHPTVKPVALMEWLVRLVTRPGALVLDPFCGSGSTGVACRRLNRSFLGIEKDAEYCEVARRRIAAPVTVDLFEMEGRQAHSDGAPTPRRAGRGKADDDAETKRKLKALGYM